MKRRIRITKQTFWIGKKCFQTRLLFFGDSISGVTARAAVDVIYPNSNVSDVSQGKEGPTEIPI